VTPPNVGELMVFPSAADVTRLCGTNAIGCAQMNLSAAGVIERASVFIYPYAPMDVITHEIGHAVLGLRHVQAVSGLPVPIMLFRSQNSDRLLTALEQEAVRQVYRRGLRGGADRGDFMAKNLIVR